MRWRSVRPWDLVAVSGLLLAVDLLVLLGVEGWLRVALGLPAVLFAPGYALVAALFPERRRALEVQAGEDLEERRRSETGLDGLERLALSLGLSIAVVPLLGLALNFSPWGIRLWPVLAAISLFTWACAGVAARRRAALPEAERFVLELEVSPPAWKGASPLDRALTVALVVAILAAGSALAYVLTKPREGERFTEFYVLGPGGMAEGYPTNLSAGEEGRLILGVVNHEGARVEYAARMVAQPGRLVNGTTGSSFEATGNVTLQTWTIPLDAGAKWEENVTFRLDEPGSYRLAFELDMPGAESPYRRLHLFVTVTG